MRTIFKLLHCTALFKAYWQLFINDKSFRFSPLHDATYAPKIVLSAVSILFHPQMSLSQHQIERKEKDRRQGEGAVGDWCMEWQLVEDRNYKFKRGRPAVIDLPFLTCDNA